MLVLGGEKSGKSTFVRNIAQKYNKVLCLFFAPFSDSNSYFQHAKARPISWDVLEETATPSCCLRRFGCNYDLVVLDDVSVWISNIIALKMNVYCEVDRILSVLSSIKHKLVVSKELGLGIIPNSPLVLKYTNLVSCVNQVFARTLNSVYFVIASNAIKIK